MHDAKLIRDGKLICSRAGLRGGDLGSGNSIEMDEVVVDWSPRFLHVCTQPVHFRIKENSPLTFHNMPTVPFNKCTSSVRVTSRSGQLAI